jgi:hypothetical protein
METPKTTETDNWNRLSVFLKLHENDIRQKRHGTNDKLYNAAVQELGADTISSKSVFMIILSFYRRVQHLTPIYQPNKYYTPATQRIVPDTSIPQDNILQCNT